MARYAIIIGVERYAQFSPTIFAHADASLIHRTLTEHCDYAAQHTLLLKLDADTVMQPPQVLDAIRKAVDGSTPGDTVFFYFAGHGHFSDGRTYLILPDTLPGAYETTALPLDDISNELRRSQRSCFRVFDACHSGLDVRDGNRAPDSNAFIRAVTHDASGWVTLAACREDQYSIPDPQIGHGVFTYYLCDYIHGLKPDEAVLPELLKVGIADRVFEHAKRLGYTQTPTLNASISGNISLATRRADARPHESATPLHPPGNELQTRIAKLRNIPDMFDKVYLQEVLKCLIYSVKNELEAKNELSSGPVVVGPSIRATDIPEAMHREIVNFAQRQGFQCRHELARWEEEYESPFTSLVTLLSNRKEKRICYNIWQSADLPESAAILDMMGDGRCVPMVKVLIYVLPLQLTTCLLVSAFRQGWPPRESGLELLCHSYQTERPGTPPNHANELAPFAVKRVNEYLYECVRRRVEQLESELKK